jgi:hypothetical protein
MDESADSLLLVKTMRLSVGERIDPVEQPILVGFNRCLEGVDHRCGGGLPQKPKKCYDSQSISPKVGLRPINIGLRRPVKKGIPRNPTYIGLNLRFGRAKRVDLRPPDAAYCYTIPENEARTTCLPHGERGARNTPIVPTSRHETCGQIDARVFRAARRWGRSTILPSTPSAPASGLASNAATILRACAISASDGA